jgi:hypothetical protein
VGGGAAAGRSSYCNSFIALISVWITPSVNGIPDEGLGIDLEILQKRKDLCRGARQDGKSHGRMFDAKGSGERRDDRKCSGDRGHAHAPGQPVPQGAYFLTHGARVAYNAARPIKYALPLRREALKARAAFHEENCQRFLKLLQPSRQCRLRHPAALRCASEMLLVGQSQQKFELIEQSTPPGT